MKKLSIKQKEHIKKVLKKVGIGISVAFNVIFTFILIASVVITLKGHKASDTVHTEVIKSKGLYKPNDTREYITDYDDIQVGQNLNTDYDINGTLDEGSFSQPTTNIFNPVYKPRLDTSDYYIQSFDNSVERLVFPKSMSWAVFDSIFNHKYYQTLETIEYGSNSSYNEHRFAQLFNNVACIGFIPLTKLEGQPVINPVYTNSSNPVYDYGIALVRSSSTHYDIYLVSGLYNGLSMRTSVLGSFDSRYPYMYLNANGLTDTRKCLYQHIFNSEDIYYGVCWYLNNNDIDNWLSYIYQGYNTRCVLKFLAYFSDKSFKGVNLAYQLEKINESLFANGAATGFPNIQPARFAYQVYSDTTEYTYIPVIYGDFYYQDIHYNAIQAIFKKVSSSDYPTIYYRGITGSLDNSHASISTGNYAYLYGYRFYDVGTNATSLICRVGIEQASVAGSIAIYQDSYIYENDTVRYFTVYNLGIYKTFYGYANTGQGTNFNVVINGFVYINSSNVDDGYIFVSPDGTGAIYTTMILINSAFIGLTGLFGYSLIPGLTLGTLLSIPIVLTLLLFVIKLFKR